MSGYLPGGWSITEMLHPLLLRIRPAHLAAGVIRRVATARTRATNPELLGCTLPEIRRLLINLIQARARLM
jgi:hypothetical protein